MSVYILCVVARVWVHAGPLKESSETLENEVRLPARRVPSLGGLQRFPFTQGMFVFLHI